ncbi:MAG: lactonase family protein [Clostridiales Family XIII bacterium]|nr:lactonase family protein [Clostridiales Family XIII bacterium]
MAETYIYISRWNEFVGDPGIALLAFDSQDGSLTFLENLEEDLSCGCTCIDKNRNMLYITNEIKENPDCFKGGGGLICAYKIDPETGRLTRVSRVPACCPCPHYLSIDPSGKYLLCANHSAYFAVTKAVRKEDGAWGMDIVYDDATVDMFELNEDGSIGKLVDVAKHTGVKNGFLLHSHPHSAVWAPSGRFFACCDKGDDLVYMYRIDYENKKMVLMCEPNRDDENSMPRYCAFHPTKPFFFNNHERNTEFSSFRYDENGRLEKICSVSAIPENIALPKAAGFKPGEKPAQQMLTVSADGKYIYNAVNGKGIDGVAVFEVNQDNGALKLIQYRYVDGQWARGVTLSPDGRFLIVSCLDGDGAVLSFSIGRDGKLTPTGSRVSLPGAAYATFI